MGFSLLTTTGPQRLRVAAATGAAVALLPLPLDPRAQGLLAWVLAVTVFLALAWVLAVRFDAPQARAHAQSQDEPSTVLLVLLVLTVVASVAAIAAMLFQARDLRGWARAGHVLLSMAALGASWLFMHTIFAFRYAHRYFQGERQGQPGLDFPGETDPDYFDFLYYALVVGMTSQVSDVQVTGRAMRRLTTVHSVLAFGFNMAVVALSINVVAGLAQ